MNLDERQRKFIGYLLSLAKEGSEDRGALADLRSGLGKHPGEMARVHKHVVEYLPEERWNDRWYYTIATLFGLFPKHRAGCSLAKAFAALKRESDSMEARFVALLNAHPDDLADHLRHAVSLLKSKEHSFDWFRLFGDLLHWSRPDGAVQLRWARDFYGTAPEDGADSENATGEENDNDE